MTDQGRIVTTKFHDDPDNLDHESNSASTFASLLIDSRANPKAIQEFMGHATIQMTFDRCGYLMPGRRDEARETIDAYLSSAPTQPVA